MQVMGIVVPGLSSELQPVANYLVPHIVNNLRDPADTNLQVVYIVDLSSANPQSLTPNLRSYFETLHDAFRQLLATLRRGSF
jgi:hypothetical protein